MQTLWWNQDQNTMTVTKAVYHKDNSLIRVRKKLLAEGDRWALFLHVYVGLGATTQLGGLQSSYCVTRAGITAVVRASLLSLFANSWDLATHFHSGKAEIWANERSASNKSLSRANEGFDPTIGSMQTCSSHAQRSVMHKSSWTFTTGNHYKSLDFIQMAMRNLHGCMLGKEYFSS